jgi:hypothetical protein
MGLEPTTTGITIFGCNPLMATVFAELMGKISKFLGTSLLALQPFFPV